jgi:hypothetical protein
VIVEIAVDESFNYAIDALSGRGIKGATPFSEGTHAIRS